MSELTSMQETLAESQARVAIKRELRKRGVKFENTTNLSVLEELLRLSSANPEEEETNNGEVWVTFDRFSPTPYKKCKAVKVVTQHSEKFFNDGYWTDHKWESVSYLIDGQSYGEEFFVK